MSSKSIATVVRFWVFALCVVWIGVVGWREVAVSGGPFGIGGVTTRSAARSCSGSFSNRYECRSSRLISGDNAIFISWGKGIAVVFLPPLVLLYLFGKYTGRRQDREIERVRQAVLARKRAQRESESKLST